jgi:hypothetical protein
VIAACRLLIERHGGQVPRTRAALEALPGVGRKTANVVLNVAFGEPTMRWTRTSSASSQPHRAGAGEDAAAHGRTGHCCVACWSAVEFKRRRPPLADPARTLHLQGTQAGLRALRDPRPLPMARENRASQRRCRMAVTCR